MTKKQERNIIASIGTVLFMGLVVLLLWILELTVTKPKDQDYIEVTLAEELEEMPEEEIPQPQPEKAGAEEGASSPTKSEPANRPTQTTAEHIVSEEELLAIRQQKIADSIAEANKQAKKKAEDLIGGFTFSETEENGEAETKTPQGGAGTGHNGEGSDGVNRWSLAGRGLVGNLPKPSKEFNQEGWIEVEISVNASGTVMDATFKRGTISDPATRKLAIDAAKKAKFTQGESAKQVGTITYYFKFN